MRKIKTKRPRKLSVPILNFIPFLDSKSYMSKIQKKSSKLLLVDKKGLLGQGRKMSLRTEGLS